MTFDRAAIERAFLMQEPVNDKIDFGQTMNAISMLHIKASTSFIEKLFCEFDHDGDGRLDLERFLSFVQQLQEKLTRTDDDSESDEESVSQSNSDKAKAFEKVVLLAQTKGSVTPADIDAIMKEITGK